MRGGGDACRGRAWCRVRCQVPAPRVPSSAGGSASRASRPSGSTPVEQSRQVPRRSPPRRPVEQPIGRGRAEVRQRDVHASWIDDAHIREVAAGRLAAVGGWRSRRHAADPTPLRRAGRTRTPRSAAAQARRRRPPVPRARPGTSPPGRAARPAAIAACTAGARSRSIGMGQRAVQHAPEWRHA